MFFPEGGNVETENRTVWVRFGKGESYVIWGWSVCVPGRQGCRRNEGYSEVCLPCLLDRVHSSSVSSLAQRNRERESRLFSAVGSWILCLERQKEKLGDVTLCLQHLPSTLFHEPMQLNIPTNADPLSLHHNCQSFSGYLHRSYQHSFKTNRVISFWAGFATLIKWKMSGWIGGQSLRPNQSLILLIC